MAPFQDLTGRRFGRWLALVRAPLPKKTSGRVKNGWLCRCDCGTERVIPTQQLLSGRSTSCGCKRTESTAKAIHENGRNTLGRFHGTVVSQLRRKTLNRNNKSGVRGVYWSAGERRYIAKIGVQGRTVTLGRFQTLEEAAQARAQAEKKYFSPLLAAFRQTARSDAQSTQKD